MSILSDRRTLREIGGFRAYLTQVGWSIWWRTQPGAQTKTAAEWSHVTALPRVDARRSGARRAPRASTSRGA